MNILFTEINRIGNGGSLKSLQTNNKHLPYVEMLHFLFEILGAINRMK